MPLHFIRTDITRFKCDAIVVAADSSLMAGDRAFDEIKNAVGKPFRRKLRKHISSDVGNTKILEIEFRKLEYVIVAVAPVWKDGKSGEIELLTACYINSLNQARDKGFKKVAVSLIDSDSFGIPSEIAQQVTEDAIYSWLETHEMDVYLISFERKKEASRSGHARMLHEFLEMCYRPHVADIITSYLRDVIINLYAARATVAPFPIRPPVRIDPFKVSAELEKELKKRDESFAQMLFRKIDELGIKDSECYRRAHVSKQVFSKIRCNSDYHPKKPTVLAFAVALNLSFEETVEMLQKAGHAFSQHSRFDIIVTYFIKNTIYDVGIINEYLLKYDQSLLGSDIAA